MLSTFSHSVSDPTGRDRLRCVATTDDPRSAEWSRDGIRVVSAPGSSAIVFDMAGGREVLRLVAHDLSIKSASFTPDERRIVTANSDGTLRMWDAGVEDLLHTLSGYSDRALSCSFWPVGSGLSR